MPPFSERQGYAKPPAIQFRDELSKNMRWALLRVVLQRIEARQLEQLVERIVDRYGVDPPPSPGFSPTGEGAVNDVVMYRFDTCPWFHLYDIIEAVQRRLTREDQEQERTAQGGKLQRPRFAREVNGFFSEVGIGWQLLDGKIVTRGDEGFERILATAVEALNDNDKPTAASRLHFAVAALSARPNADTSGAVSHATSAVECVLHDLTGESLTLGEHLKRQRDLFHPALRKGLDGLYGYASDEGARHGKEGITPTRQDADLIVAVCAAVCTYLTLKQPQ
jgi:hypothetical protein